MWDGSLGDMYSFHVGVSDRNHELFALNGTNCLLTLLGMSVGFVLSSTIAHYIRKTLFRRRKSTVHAAKAK